MWNSGTGTSATRQVKPPVAHPLGIETSCETADTAGANYLSRVYYFGASSYPEGGAYIGLWILIPHEGYRTEAHGGFPAVELPANEWVFVKTTEKVTGVALGIRIRTVDDSIVDPEHRGYLTGAVVSATPIDHFFDGSTVSDRAHDLWYNADGAPPRMGQRARLDRAHRCAVGSAGRRYRVGQGCRDSTGGNGRADQS